MAITAHHHRSSSALRQSNKKHKTNGMSKRLSKKLKGGKQATAISVTSKSPKHLTKKGGNELGSKQKRRLFNKQKLNNNKNQKGVYYTSSAEDEKTCPLIVSLLNLSNDKSIEQQVMSNLTSICSKQDENAYYYSNLQAGVRYYNLSHDSSIHAILNQSRISNHFIMLLSASSSEEERSSYISPRAEEILTAMKAQGLSSSSIHILFIPSSQAPKTVQKQKRYLTRLFSAEFSTQAKIHLLQDIKMLLRHMSLATQTKSKYILNTPRSYIVSEQGWNVDLQAQELVLGGCIRNAPFDLNALFHVGFLGICPIVSIEDSKTKEVLFENTSIEHKGIEFANPDALEGEQNLIGFEEEEEDEMNQDVASMSSKVSQQKKADYFSAWYDDLLDPKELKEQQSLTNTFNQPTVTPTPSEMDLDENLYEKRKEYATEKQFPDEIELTPEENARDRLARFRSLKSFRTSYWDPKENLPEDYGRIFHFANFRGTKKDVLQDVVHSIIRNDHNDDDDDDDDDVDMKEKDDAIPVGTLVTIKLSISSIAEALLHRLSHEQPKLLSGITLLPHENKVSVLHMNITPVSKLQTPIKSKEPLMIQCGWRSFTARPIYSQANLNCDKHKLERYMPQESFSVMSVYGPVSFDAGSAPVLVFQNNTLVATGSLVDIDADRLIVKRSIITGFPTRVHKKWATVKYMFYNPEDVKWFKPAGLTTKHGLQGNILESVGEHGCMKCLFSQNVKQHDTICLPLYKRVYPKFAAFENGDDLVVW